MTAFANTTPAPGTGGMPYATGTPVTGTEADLFNQARPPFFDPVPVPSEHEAVLAVIQLAISGNVSSNTTYIVLQTDLGDGLFVDVAWIQWNGTSGNATFVISAGGSQGRAIQMTRTAGTSPGASGSNQIPLGGRIRFVGKASLGVGSSSSSSSPQSIGGVSATIKYLFLKVWGG